MDVDRIADLAQNRFPALSMIDSVPGQAGDASGIIQIERLQAVLQLVTHKVSDRLWKPPGDVMRSWNPDAALKGHRAHLNISCGGRLPGLDGAQEYAGAVHLIAAIACEVMGGTGILWQNSWGLHSPETFGAEANTLLDGKVPLSSWVSFAPFVPDGFEPHEAMGMMTYGLRHFLGRELELAPYPDDTEGAYQCLSSVARMVLESGLALRNGGRVEDSTGEISMAVRERTFHLRRDRSAFVLIPKNSVLDHETLKPIRIADQPYYKAS